MTEKEEKQALAEGLHETVKKGDQIKN